MISMPRRSPGETRAELPWRRNHGSRTVIRGLSASANRQIARFERVNRLLAGTVAQSFAAWSRVAERRPLRTDRVEVFWADEHGEWGNIDLHPRSTIEQATRTMGTRARRELQKAVTPLDDRVLARTTQNPFAPTDLPWWKRRLEI